MTENYDTSWDLTPINGISALTKLFFAGKTQKIISNLPIESNKGNLPYDEDAYERKYQEWKTRDWPLWLKDHFIFPFTLERMEDEDNAYFTDVAKHEPFSLDHIMKVINVEPEEDDLYGVIVQVREGRRKGYVPLCDLEITARDDRNFWSVREYVVWFANR